MEKTSINVASAALSRMPSDRSFGFFFSLVFFLCGLVSKESLDESFVFLFFIFSLAFFAISLVRAEKLRKLNLIWFQIGKALGRIINPIAIGILFYAVVSPIAIVTRLFGRDELRLRRVGSDSYWISLPPPKDNLNDFQTQF